MSLFGIAPIAGVGDETIANFNVPAFKYGSETYTRVGVVSDGYVVIGGGTGTDVDFVAQPIPSAARPNNIVAPFWNDLNPAQGGEIRIGTLTDGVDTWLVVDYTDVVYFGTTIKNSFQTWIQLGATENVTIANGVVDTTTPDGTLLGQGAENRDGTSGATYVGGSDTRLDRQHGSPDTWWQRHGDLRRVEQQARHLRAAADRDDTGGQGHDQQGTDADREVTRGRAGHTARPPTVGVPEEPSAPSDV